MRDSAPTLRTSVTRMSPPAVTSASGRPGAPTTRPLARDPSLVRERARRAVNPPRVVRRGEVALSRVERGRGRERRSGCAGRKAQAQTMVGRAVVEAGLAQRSNGTPGATTISSSRVSSISVSSSSAAGSPRIRVTCSCSIPEACRDAPDDHRPAHGRFAIERIAVVAVAAVTDVLDAEQPVVLASTDRHGERAVVVGTNPHVVGGDLAAVVDVVGRPRGGLEPEPARAERRNVACDELDVEPRRKPGRNVTRFGSLLCDDPCRAHRRRSRPANEASRAGGCRSD